MTRKLTPEEKLFNKLETESRKKLHKQINYCIGLVFCIVGLVGALCLKHISTDSALLYGFFGGIGYQMLSDLKF